MSPRVIQIPLSGGDRKNLARNLSQARSTYDTKMRQAQEAQRIADLKLHEARLARCEAWNAAMFMGGPSQPSPTIEDALAVGCDELEVKCNRCDRYQRLKIRNIKRIPSTFLWQLEPSLGCEPCRAETRYKPKAIITGLLMSDPPPEPPASRQAR